MLHILMRSFFTLTHVLIHWTLILRFFLLFLKLRFLGFYVVFIHVLCYFFCNFAICVLYHMFWWSPQLCYHFALLNSKLSYVLVLWRSYAWLLIYDVLGLIFMILFRDFLLTFCIVLLYFIVCSINLTCFDHFELLNTFSFEIFCFCHHFVYVVCHMS